MIGMYGLRIVRHFDKRFLLLGSLAEVNRASDGFEVEFSIKGYNLDDVNRPRPEINCIPANRRLVVMEHMTGEDANEMIRASNG